MIKYKLQKNKLGEYRVMVRSMWFWEPAIPSTKIIDGVIAYLPAIHKTKKSALLHMAQLKEADANAKAYRDTQKQRKAWRDV